MRCLGLTAERHRCEQGTVQASEYCADHQPEGTPTPMARVASGTGWLERLAAHFHGPNGVPQVADPAHFPIPASLQESATPVVIDHLLNHPDSTMRWCAAFVLRKRRDPIALEPLWHALLHDPSRLTRQQAAVALGKIGTVAVLGPLVEALFHDLDPGVRQASAVALGNLGYPAAAKDVVSALERESDYWVRWDLVLALGQLGDSSHEPLLLKLEAEEQSPYIRTACQEALTAIRRRHSGKQLNNPTGAGD